MSPKVCKKSLKTLFSVGLKKTKLLSNYKKLSKLELSEDYDAFYCFVFWLVILNKYEK